MELRNYQKKIISEVYAHYRKKERRVLLQLPTGGGKSLTSSKIIRDAVSRDTGVLVGVHRAELIDQMHSTLGRVGVHSGIIKSGRKGNNASTQVASIQTLARRLDQYDPKRFGLVVIDECHHFTNGNQYSSVLEHFSGAFLLGLTATPTRLDGRGLGDVFDYLVHGPQLHELVEQGYLVPPEYFVAESVAGDRDVAKNRSGDYSSKGLSEAVSELQLQGDLVAAWKEHALGLQTCVFAVNIAHSESIAEAYELEGIASNHIDGKTPEHLRKAILKDFDAGVIKILSNVGIVTEGFDVPAIGCVQLARPTLSVSLYYQMIGRALRPAPGKTRAVVLDHAGCYDAHGNVLTPYFWQLRETKPKEATADWLEESEPAERKERIITQSGEKLIKVSFSLDRAWFDELRRLQRVQENKDYKPSWVAHRMMERFGAMTLEQYRVIAKVCGYHWKWADRQHEKVAA